jgi:hypothetical protein
MKQCFTYILILSSFISCATTENSPFVTENSPPVIPPSTPTSPATFHDTTYFSHFSQVDSKGRGSIWFIKVGGDGSIISSNVSRYYLEDSPPLADVINELLNGPTDSETEEGLISLIPPGTRLLSCLFEDLTLHLNFNEEFLFNKYGMEGYRAQLLQIIRTLKEYPIREVQFLIEGRKIDYLGERIWIGSPLLVNPEADTKTWLAEQEVTKEEFNNFVAEHKKSTPILISLYNTEKPNSANSVSCSIQFTNISDKRIKYVYFTVTPYNRVNDIAYSDIGRLSTTEIEVVDYILPYESYHTSWENVWYNSTIAYMKIVRIRIIFDDNSALIIEEQDGLDKAILMPDEYKRFSRFLKVNKKGTL